MSLYRLVHFQDFEQALHAILLEHEVELIPVFEKRMTAPPEVDGDEIILQVLLRERHPDETCVSN